MNKDVTEISLVENFISKVCKRKKVDDMLAQSEKDGLKKTLTAFDLIILGIGAVVGSGIFTIIGVAAAGGIESVGAGPALVVSMLLAAIACVFSALCYSEFSSMIPVAGSAYTYTYATMGEFAAWLVGWILMLEYAIGNIAVASAWTGYLFQFLKGFSAILPSWLVNPPLWLVSDYRTLCFKYQQLGLNPETEIPKLFGVIPFAINLPAICILLLITLTLIKGIKESTKMAGVMVIIKLAVILLFILIGAFYVKPENWIPFAPNGFSGIFMGAFIIFFAYIGFDAISTAAEETQNPQKDLPVGIIGSLVICTVIYILVAVVLTGMMPISQIDVHAPIAYAIRFVGQDWVAGLIALGALTGLTSVLLVLQLGATRILFAMARDNFLPRALKKVHSEYKTPHVITWLTFAFVVLGTLFLDLNVAAELCNFGTFTSFIIVCIGVLILRKTDPDRPRPFKVPFSPLFPILGIVSCSGLMIYSLKFLKVSSLLFPVWLLLGVLIYLLYGYNKNRRVEAKQLKDKEAQLINK